VETAQIDSPATQDVLCPLCGYNLRGLPEARCPECGGKFDWPDLLDPTRKLHPYLFEHHPRRNIRSFIRTVIGGTFPRRFWQTLHPAQPSRPRRLVLYWLIVAQFVLRAIDVRRDMLERREQTRYFLGLGARPPSFRWPPASQTDLDNIKQDFGSLQQYLDSVSPEPTFRMVLSQTPIPLAESTGLAALARGNFSLSFAFSLSLGLLLWPWIAVLIMMMLRTTMRQASVHPTHLLRVTIYSGDVVLWLILFETGPLLISLLERMNNAQMSTALWNLTDDLRELFIYAPSLIALVLTYRFASAIRRYLRFRHAVGVAVAVQVIFLLLVLQMMSWLCA
jgi:hypothetical protein